MPDVRIGTTHCGTPLLLSKTSNTFVCDLYEQPDEAADFIYFINYEI